MTMEYLPKLFAFGAILDVFTRYEGLYDGGEYNLSLMVGKPAIYRFGNRAATYGDDTSCSVWLRDCPTQTMIFQITLLSTQFTIVHHYKKLFPLNFPSFNPFRNIKQVVYTYCTTTSFGLLGFSFYRAYLVERRIAWQMCLTLRYSVL